MMKRLVLTIFVTAIWPVVYTLWECKNGLDDNTYMGTKSVTAHDIPCQRWDSQEPHRHAMTDPSLFPDRSLTRAANYCRNPNGREGGPWCFTIQPDIEWQYCDIPYCDCKQTTFGREYVGTLSMTTSFKRCQFWTSQSPHPHPFYDPNNFPDWRLEDAQNFCRNPDNKPEGPWCLTLDNSTEWEYCNIPRCECKYSNEGWEYQGRIRETSSGRTCQRWDSQSPHEHDNTNSSSFPDATLSDASNFCRNPNGRKGGPWCHTTDSRTTWEYCKIRFCDCKLRYEGYEYTGKVSWTISGNTCQRWDSQSPHPHDTQPEDLPDLSLTRAENYCRNPGYDEKLLGPWCYTTDPEVEWAYCNVPLCECKLELFGNNYLGKQSVTNKGNICQRWDKQTPHQHKNYTEEMFPDYSLFEASNFCRNPEMVFDGPGCYTTDPNTVWDYCAMPLCQNYPEFVLPTYQPPHVKECKKTRLGWQYMGRTRVTVSGRTCQQWTSQTPHRHEEYIGRQFPDYSIENTVNYCRNPTNEPSGPWCFTTDPNVRWEYCSINYCDCKETIDGFAYNGHIKETLSGVPCQRWDKQSPHPHNFTDANYFPERTLHEVSNNCRNPDNRKGGAWCYTTDPQREWEFCNIPLCECKQDTKGTRYSGGLTATDTGKSCQRWDSQYPHEHNFRDHEMIDGNLTAAGAQCRNPNSRDRPWCFTTDNDTRWEYCNVQDCRLDGMTTTPYPDGCPQRIGRNPSNLPRTGGTNAHLMITNSFPCNGVITDWEYWRINREASGYIAIWRWDPSDPLRNHVIVVAKTRIQISSDIGLHIVPLDSPIAVKQGDFIGVHYSAGTKGAMIANSRGNDGVVADYDLHDTVVVSRFDEDFKIGNKIDISGVIPKRSTFAVQAWFRGDRPPIPTTRPMVTRPPPPTKSPSVCPDTIGRFPTDLPRRGGTYTHIMLNNTFPCDGYITAWHYYRSNTETTPYVAIWRKGQELQKYGLVKQWALFPPDQRDIGNIILTLAKKFAVKKGDCIGIHYSRIASIPAITNSRGNDSVVKDEELFETINIPRYKEDFHEGNKLDFSGITTIKSTYALQAFFEGTPPINKGNLNLSPGAIVGITIGIVAVLVAIIGIVYVLNVKQIKTIQNLRERFGVHRGKRLQEEFDNPSL